MSKRIGKYKVGKRESFLHKNRTGDLTITGTVRLEGVSAGTFGSLTTNQVYITGSQHMTSSNFNVLMLG